MVFLVWFSCCSTRSLAWSFPGSFVVFSLEKRPTHFLSTCIRKDRLAEFRHNKELPKVTPSRLISCSASVCITEKKKAYIRILTVQVISFFVSTISSCSRRSLRFNGIMILYKKLGLFHHSQTRINHSYICNPALQLEPEPGFYCLSMGTFTFQKRATTLSLCPVVCWSECSFSWMDRADLPWSDAPHMWDVNGVPCRPHRCCFFFFFFNGIFAMSSEQFDRKNYPLRI